MPHALSITSPRTLLVLLSSTLALACAKDDPKKPAPAAATAGSVGTPTSGTGKPVADVVAPVAMGTGKVAMSGGGEIHGLTAEPDILGHFVIANASQLIADVKTQLVPPKYAGFLEEAALRSLVSIALDKRGNLAMNYELAAPLGCALIEPRVEDLKLGCVFGYKGGATAFVGDIGDMNKQADAAGHTAVYGVEGKSVYVDALGDRVVVSSGADTFGKTQAYLQRNVLDRAGNIHGDIEVVAYVSTVLERYRSDLEPLFAKVGETPMPVTNNPAVDAALKAFSDYRVRSSKTGFERIGEMAQFSMFFSVEPAGVMMGGALFPKAGSRMAQEMAVYGAPKLDPAFAGIAPAGTASLFAFNLSPRAQELASVGESRQMVGEVWGALSGRDATLVTAAIAAYQKENAELYEGHTLVALGREPNALFGLELAQRLQTGKSARDAWKAWSAVFTPEVVLGSEFSKFVTWSFKPDAATVDGVAVDRWTIEPGPAIKAEMQKDIDSKPEAKAFITKALGGVYLNIDRAETGGNVIFTIAPKAEASYMKRAIAAAAGKDNVAGEPGLTKLLARDPEAGGVLAIDLKAGIEWLRDLKEFGARTDELPNNLGTDLGDFYFTVRYTSEGATAMEYVFSQQLIEQIKALIPT